MKDEEIKEAFEAVASELKAASQEEVNKACEKLCEEATSLLGAGVYVKGLLNKDMGGISFRFRRPSLRIRLEHFVEIDLKPKTSKKKKAAEPSTDK